MNDTQKFAAVVQALMALALQAAIAIVAFALLGLAGYAVLHKMPMDQALAGLLNTVVNALINMGAIGVGFWLARHRPQQADGSDDSEPIPQNPTEPANPAGVKK